MAADQIINAYLAGKQLVDQRRRQAMEDEDRAVEKDLLAHRLRELKLTDKLRAFQFKRQGAESQFAALQGAQEADIPSGWAEEGGMSTSFDPDMGVSRPNLQMRLVTFPGFSDPDFPEYETPGFVKRPETWEAQAIQRAIEARRKAVETPFTLGEGGVRMGPNAAGTALEPWAINPKGPIVPPPGSEADYLAREETRLGRQLTQSEMDTVRRRRAAATRPPKAPKDTTLTRAERGAAEAWRFTQLKALDAAVRASSAASQDIARLSPEAQALYLAFNVGGRRKTPLSKQEIADTKADIERVYRQKLGLADIPSAEARQPTKTPIASPLVGKTVRLADGRSVKVKAVYADGSFDSE